MNRPPLMLFGCYTSSIEAGHGRRTYNEQESSAEWHGVCKIEKPYGPPTPVREFFVVGWTSIRRLEAAAWDQSRTNMVEEIIGIDRCAAASVGILRVCTVRYE